MLANCIYSLPPEFQVPWQESDEKLRLVVLEVARRWHAVDGTTVVATEASTPAESWSLRLACNCVVCPSSLETHTRTRTCTRTS